MPRVLVIPLLLLLTACFEVEQSIDLQKDLSGTADFHLGIDMEPMVVVMAQIGREMGGKRGPLTPAELASAKADFKRSMSRKRSAAPPSKEEFAKDLPEGVEVLDAKVTERDFGVATDIRYGFDQLSRLVGVKLVSKAFADPTGRNIIDTPFEGLEVIEDGDVVTIRTKPMNPVDKVSEQAAEAPKLDAATEKMIKDAFGKMRVVYRINAPFTVISHNATRKEGNTLVWEYDFAKFESMAKAKKLDDAGVLVTYKR